MRGAYCSQHKNHLWFYITLLFLVTRRRVGARDKAQECVCVWTPLFVLASSLLQTAQQLVTRRHVYCRQHNNQPEVLITTYCCLVKRQFVGTLTARLSRPNNYHRRSRLCSPLYILHDMQHNMQWPVKPPLSMILSL